MLRINKRKSGAREMAQGLGARVAVAEDPGWIPSTDVIVYNCP